MNTDKSKGIEIPIAAIDTFQRKAAGAAGFSFLFAMALLVIANYGINFRLIIPNNAVDTAGNIMAHETLFRINIVCNLIYVVTVLVMLTTFYMILEPVNKNLAMVIFEMVLGLWLLLKGLPKSRVNC